MTIVIPIGGSGKRHRSVPRSRVNSGDTSIDRRGRARNAPPILSYGFRPFFLLGAIYASVAVPAWLLVHSGAASPAGPFSGLAWHAHEMIFGYLGAVMAGFILTAVPNWTGRLPISGAPLAGLVMLWAIGRAAVFLDPEPVSAAILDLAFPVVLVAAVWREIAAGHGLKNAPVALLLSLFMLANLADHAGAQLPVLDGFGIRLALGVATLLIALVGGRVVPSFTRNWMARAELLPLPAPMDHLDRLALATTGIAILGWIVAPDAAPVGAGLLAAGVLLLARLSRWRGYRTLREPIVFVLHLGYFWLAASLLLLGLAILLPSLVPASSAIHALTAGAVGTMTLAVMTRATRGHTGRPIVADGPTLAIYAFVTVGALLRVLAPLAGEFYSPVLILGGATWSAAFMLFALAYGPMLAMKRLSPELAPGDPSA
jgi:uncharacterized protein involved in response to NO